MKVFIISFVVAAVIVVECSHTFIGTSVQRDLVVKQNVYKEAKSFQKSITTYNVTIPYNRLQNGYIQGILAYDLTKSDASVNVTNGGIGYSFVNLRFKSDRGKPVNYELYIYG